MKQAISKLKEFFGPFKMPTASNFGDWIDSFWHKDGKIPASNIEGWSDDSAVILEPGVMELPDLGDETKNKTVRVLGGADGKVYTYKGVTIPIQANYEAILFWDGTLKVWKLQDEAPMAKQDVSNLTEKGGYNGTTQDVVDYIINTNVDNIVQSPQATLNSSYISITGAITSAGASYSVQRYDVQDGDIIKVSGTLTANASTNFCVAMFKTTPDMTGSGTSLKNVASGTVSGTVVSLDYTATEDGYLFITQWNGLPITVIKVVTTVTNNIDKLQSDVEDTNTNVSAIQSTIYKDVVEDVPVVLDGSASSKYIAVSGVVTNAAASYSVYRYAAIAGKTYKVKGTSIAATNTNFSALSRKSTPEIEGTCTTIYNIASGTPAGTAYSNTYVPTEDTYLFVTSWNNFPLSLFEVVEEEINRISESEERLDKNDVTLAELQKQLAHDAIDNLFGLYVDNPLYMVRYYPGLCAIFRDWGFIGDSLTSGQMEYKVGSVTNYINLYDYSWGQVICRLTGATGYNFSVGGQTSKGWCQSHGPAERRWEGAQTNVKKSYFISLATNDRNQYNAGSAGSYPPGDVATDINMSDYNLNADTYAGWMGGIIQRVRSIQSRAKIFLVTLPKPAVTDTTNIELWNKVIRDLATKFTGVYVIDIYKYGVIEGASFKSRYWMGGHMNAAGYAYRAYQFITYIDWIVRNNQLAFAEEAYVGTDYHYYS